MAKHLTEMTDEERDDLTNHLKKSFVDWATSDGRNFAGSSENRSIYSGIEQAVYRAAGKLGLHKMSSLIDDVEQIHKFEMEEVVNLDMENKTIDLLDPVTGMRTKDEPYFIHFNRIDTPEKVLGWLIHLREKTWFTTVHMWLLIATADRYARRRHKSFIEHG